ncbi:MAG: DUF5677 domain-containing protein [Bryobacteraceae bacterium]
MATIPCALCCPETVQPEINNWASFTQAMPEFVDVFHTAFRTIPQLVLDTTPADNDDAGLLVCQLMMASLHDLDDIMLLCCKDRHWGALKLLRSVFDRTVTVKYLAQNPKEVRAFVAFDAVDWKAVLSGIEKRYGIKAEAETLTRIEAAVKDFRDKFRQEPCDKCGMRKQTSWTPRSSLELAQKTGLEYLHFEAFVLPSKYIHPTYFGTRHLSRESPTPMHNTLKATHALAVETILVHQRFFKNDPLASPLALEAVQGFFRVWKYADTDFGLGEHAARVGLQFVPLPVKSESRDP